MRAALQQRGNYTMSDRTCNSSKSFNLPSYINIPFFLYQDDRLEKSALLIAAFFYSLHTAGKSLTASKDYLCALCNIGKTQYFYTLNQLESLGYIKRNGFTNRKKIQWVYSPKSEIIVDETDTSPGYRTGVVNLNTSPAARTKLVRDPEPILSGIPDTDIKEDTKDYKKLTTVPEPEKKPEPKESSSSFFTQKEKDDLLSYKLQDDTRSDELFLDNCQFHIESQKNEFARFRRLKGLKNILLQSYENREPFKAVGYDKQITAKTLIKAPTKEEFDKWTKCTPGYEWVGLWRNQQQQSA